jgi:hypothetical protein
MAQSGIMRSGERVWTSNRLCVVALALAIATFFLSVASQARAAPLVDSEVRRLIDAVDRVAAAEPRIKADLQANLAEKKAIALDYASINGDLAILEQEINETEAFCTGEFEEPEFSRRAAICAVKVPELNARRQALIDGRAAIDKKESERAARGLTIKTTFDDMHRRAALLSEEMDLNPAFAEIRAQCRETVSIGKWARCLRQAARAGACRGLEKRVAADRSEIERLSREISTGQQELATWSKLNADAQQGALLAGARFVAGEYAAGALAARAKVARLAREIERVARKTATARKRKVRLIYARKLQAEVERLRTPLKDLWARKGTTAVLDLESNWSVARDTLHAELQIASSRDAELRRILESSVFKESFRGEGVDTPGLDLVATLAEEAGKDLGVRALGLKKFEAMTGPHVRAAVFVRDASYNALLSLLSTSRVLQQNDLAGAFAKAAGVLQARYQIDVDALHECRREAAR